MEALVAAAVFVPMVGVVTAYNTWALYRACKDRFFRVASPRGPSGEACAERS